MIPIHLILYFYEQFGVKTIIKEFDHKIVALANIETREGRGTTIISSNKWKIFRYPTPQPDIFYMYSPNRVNMFTGTGCSTYLSPF